MVAWLAGEESGFRNRRRLLAERRPAHGVIGLRQVRIGILKPPEPRYMATTTRLIKKYPNRRLYDTQTSAYITLADVKQLVLDSENFKVIDAKSTEDLTRSILLQIILDEEAGGAPLFSSQMLAHMIRFYGHAMQGMMGAYMEKTLQTFVEVQNRMQEQSKSLYEAAACRMPSSGPSSCRARRR